MLTVTGPFVNKYIYADKTHLAQKLCERDGGRYFFVRPRRFGKSTFLATLYRVFNGSKDIFEGTYIYNHPNISWDRYPILYLDLGNSVIENVKTCNEIIKKDNPTRLEIKLGEDLEKFKANYRLSSPKKSYLPDEFASILTEIDNRGNSTVVLIDEYDFSLLNNMYSCPQAEQINKDIVRDIFLELKDKAACIKFAFVTGISKAVFTTLGSPFDLKDITDDWHFHDIAGLSESDLNEYYADHIDEVSQLKRKPKDSIVSEMKEWYNGYNFSEFAPSSLFNPLSIQNYFEKGSAKGYWSDKGHAQFLFTQMVRWRGSFSCLNLKYGFTSSLQGGLSLQYTDPALLLYDAGYVTIHSFKDGKYFLKFPNKEMEESYYRDIEYAAWVSENSTEPDIEEISTLLEKSVPDFHRFMHAINSALQKLVIRAPFEEWYSWQMMLLMARAKIPNVERETPLKLPHKTKKIDVTGFNDDIYVLIECKLNEEGNSDAWSDARESIPTFLEENMKQEKPMKLLAAGITFSSDFKNKVVSAFQAKLISSDGTVSEIYDSEDVPNKKTNFYREKNYNPKTFKHKKRSYKKRSSSTAPLTSPGPHQVSSS